MKILIEPSGMYSLNVGDQAMLEMTYDRFRSIWPNAEIRIFTKAPERLKSTLPGAIPVSPWDRGRCIDQHIFGRLSRILPRGLAASIRQIEQVLAERAPRFEVMVALSKMKLRKDEVGAALLTMLRTTDLYVYSGAGILTDAFVPQNIEALRMLDLARRLGVRTAILGHMIGPVNDESLRTACRQILPKIDFISTRERPTSLRCLRQCGVPVNNIMVTGDETIELAFNQAKRELGAALGVNVRSAWYSGLDRETVPAIGLVIKRIAQRLNAPLEPLAISYHVGSNDEYALRLLLADGDRTESSAKATEPEAAVSVIRRVGKCRLVIAGSYHAAVFALAQGIPVIGLAFAPYYFSKFDGLADLFGAGCACIDGRKTEWAQQLEQSALDLWQRAIDFKPQLIESAKRQIVARKMAYQRVRNLME